ncbi:MAG: class I SAM-dependent methyltransferase [Bacteroidota bacterium]
MRWIAADAAQFEPPENYDCWHDRAAFHFLTEEKDIRNYVENAGRHVEPGGWLVLGTFSEKAPEKCSGLPVQRYSKKSMTDKLKAFFKKIRCITTEHLTPFGTAQAFLFCSFQRLK